MLREGRGVAHLCAHLGGLNWVMPWDLAGVMTPNSLLQGKEQLTAKDVCRAVYFKVSFALQSSQNINVNELYRFSSVVIDIVLVLSGSTALPTPPEPHGGYMGTPVLHNYMQWSLNYLWIDWLHMQHGCVSAFRSRAGKAGTLQSDRALLLAVPVQLVEICVFRDCFLFLQNVHFFCASAPLAGLGFIGTMSVNSRSNSECR